MATACTKEVEDVADYIRVIPPRFCALLFISLPLLIALFVTDWISGVIALITLPVIALFMIMLGKQARLRAEKQYDESRHLANHFIDTIRGIQTLKALNASKRAGNEVYSASESMRTTTIRTLSVATLSSAVLDLITVFGIAAIAMMLAFRLMDQSMELYTALSALMLAPEYFTPLRSFASSFHASLDGRNALSAINSLLNFEKPQNDTDSKPGSDYLNNQETITNFSVKALSYTYEDGTSALKDATFSFENPAMIGIVGSSGSGKSTLINLLAGFNKPSSGSIYLNGIETNLNNQNWSERIHYIPQHPYIFRASLADNIRFYTPTATTKEILHAANLVGLETLVSQLPQGLETIIGEGNRQLSGGEAHRVALARALLDKRPVILLDEPTAHLDIETELELKQQILDCLQGRLVFIATHRLHWIPDLDYLVVLEKGTVKESATTSELLAKNGTLQKLLNTSGIEVVA